MSRYQELRMNPPKLRVKENAKELIITTVSCMCDNIHRLKLKKNEAGEFRLSGGRFSLRNWQMGDGAKIDIEWASDDEEWEEVFRIINTGTEAIESVRSR